MLPPFHTEIDDPRYGAFVAEVYHDSTECEIGQRIVADHHGVIGKGGRRLCSECSRHGPV
jgi:hypothetical protein